MTRQKQVEAKKIYLHIDADAFFASVEQCLHPELRGKPAVTGRDGSIVLALSYEAKALGIERGLPTHLLRQQFPEVHMVASDYQMYKIFSDRMFRIIASFVPGIKRTSIDECKGHFPASVTSFDEAESYAQTIKDELERKLGCQFSIGIARTPILAKIASAMEKPSGLTSISNAESLDQLYSLSIEKVPGFGRQLAPRLRKMGIGTIKQFILRYEHIRQNFSINMYHIFLGLSEQEAPERPEKLVQSMNRARSFKVTNQQHEILGQMTLNTEYLMRKIRNKKLNIRTIYLTVRDAERRSSTLRSSFIGPTDNHQEIYSELCKLLEKILTKGEAYRYVSVTFSGLSQEEFTQHDLFSEHKEKQKENTMWDTIDKTNIKFGGSYIQTASTLLKPKNLGSHLHPKANNITPRNPLLEGENMWRRIKYPFLGKV